MDKRCHKQPGADTGNVDFRGIKVNIRDHVSCNLRLLLWALGFLLCLIIHVFALLYGLKEAIVVAVMVQTTGLDNTGKRVGHNTNWW